MPPGRAGGSVVTAARLDVRDLAQIPGGHVGAGLPEVRRAVVLRRCEDTHRDAPVKLQPGDPAARWTWPAPAAPVTSTSPLTRALLSVPGV
jgi:hypothetical protein